MSHELYLWFKSFLASTGNSAGFLFPFFSLIIRPRDQIAEYTDVWTFDLLCFTSFIIETNDYIIFKTRIAVNKDLISEKGDQFVLFTVRSLNMSGSPTAYQLIILR